MLKIESPLQPGNVMWNDEARDQLRRHHMVFANFAFGEGLPKDERRLEDIATFTRGLIIANLETEDPARDSMRIAIDLTDGWTESARDMFVQQFGYGAGLNRDQIEAFVT